MAIMSKQTIADVCQKCQDTGRKLLGSLGSADLPVVIENSDEAALILYWKR